MPKFFQGWYFKCSTESETIAFIPAVHDNGKQRSISLQIVTEQGSHSISYPHIAYDRFRNAYLLGGSRFSPAGLYLNIQKDSLQLSGRLHFSSHEKINGDIMGPFQYLPFMQCRHKIYSMFHKVNGQLSINGRNLLFTEGKGYMEGDRGFSFPREYLWTQCHFEGGSLMLSIADIPMPGFQFTGIIAVIMIGGQEYRLATYNGARIVYIGNHSVQIRQGDYRFSARLIRQNSFPLHAPRGGNMSRCIQESPSCTAGYYFCCGTKVLLDFQSDMASFEYEYS